LLPSPCSFQFKSKRDDTAPIDIPLRYFTTARINTALKSPSHYREIIPECENDQALLRQARERISLSTSSIADPQQ
jgi:hypothetical protein